MCPEAKFVMKRFYSLMIGALLTVGSLYGELRPIGIAQSMEHAALDESRRGIIEGLAEAGYSDGEGLQLSYMNGQGDFSRNVQIAQFLAKNRERILVGIGTQSSQTLLAARKTRKSKAPIAYVSVTDPKAAQLDNPADAPIAGVSNFIEPKEQLLAFKGLLPGMRRVGVIYNPGEVNSVALLKASEAAAKEMGLEIVAKGAARPAEVQTAARSLVRDCDAIFINNDNTALAAMSAIVRIASKEGIPVLCSDPDTLALGVLAAYGPDQYVLGRMCAELIVAFLEEKPILETIVYPKSAQLYVNIKAAERLGLQIDADAMEGGVES